MDLKWVQKCHSSTPPTYTFACPQVNQEHIKLNEGVYNNTQNELTCKCYDKATLNSMLP